MKMTDLGRASAAAALALALALVPLPGRSDAAPAPIRIAGTGTDGVLMHSQPTVSSTRTGWMGEGASPDFQCFTYGDWVGNVNVWFLVTNAGGATGYYPSYYDDSHYSSEADLTAKYGVPKCGAAASPPPVQQAPPVPVTPITPVTPVAPPVVYGGSINFLPAGHTEGISGSQNVLYKNWANTDPRAHCDISRTASAAQDPSGGKWAPVLAGWSNGRLGPVYFLKATKNDARYSRVSFVVLIDPGRGDTFDCDRTVHAGNVLADWLRSDPGHRLVIVTGQATASDRGAGLQQTYLSQMSGLMGSQVLVCQHPSVEHGTAYNIYGRNANTSYVRNPRFSC